MRITDRDTKQTQLSTRLDKPGSSIDSILNSVEKSVRAIAVFLVLISGFQCNSLDDIDLTQRVQNQITPKYPLPPVPTLFGRLFSSTVEGQLNENMQWTIEADSPASPRPAISRTILSAAQSTVDQRLRVDQCNRVLSTGSGNDLCFFLVRPESVTGSYEASNYSNKSSDGTIADTSTMSLVKTQRGSLFRGSIANATLAPQAGGTTICDASVNRPSGRVLFRTTDGVYNPHICTGTGEASLECYDITVYHSTAGTCSGVSCQQMWATPVTIKVKNPKASNAEIDSIIPGTPVRVLGMYNHDFFTPTMSGDGRLLIYHDSMQGALYSINTGSPCSAAGWSAPSKLAHMHNDTAASAYGLAKFQLRRLDGTYYQDTDVFDSGGYFWLDIHGTNLMMNSPGGGAEAPFYYNQTGSCVEFRVPIEKPSSIDANTWTLLSSTCLCPTSCSGNSTLQATVKTAVSTFYRRDHHWMAIVGAWTAGKLIRPDVRIQKNDLGITNTTAGTITQLNAQLYNGDVSRVITSGTIHRKGSVANAFNFNQYLRPKSPFDVVWLVSTEADMDEVVFDDFLDPTLILSVPMNAIDIGYSTGINGSSVTNKSSIQFQNVAASSQWRNTQNDYAVVANDPKSRAEPAALGGVTATGFYLAGNNYLTYTTGTSTVAAPNSYFYSLWVAPSDDTGTQKILTTPDGYYVSKTSGGDLILSNSSGTAVMTVALSTKPSLAMTSANQFTHLGLASEYTGTGTILTVFVNGYQALRTTLTGVTAFRMFSVGTTSPASMIKIGESTGGLKAWVDDFKVFGRIPNREEICNQAYGTLVLVPDGQSNPIPPLNAAANTATSLDLTGGTANRYYCESKVLTLQRNLPATTTCIDSFMMESPNANCVRGKAHMPEATALTSTRPNSTTNKFCTTCHVDTHAFPPLRVASPLGLGSIPQITDPIRRPMQPFLQTYGIRTGTFFGAAGYSETTSGTTGYTGAVQASNPSNDPAYYGHYTECFRGVNSTIDCSKL